METWSPHHFFQKATKHLDNTTAIIIQKYINHLRNQKLPVIFSLGHLGKITRINYNFLHQSINRKRESANYNIFSIHKRSGKRRFIHVVNGKLYDLQKYINKEILQKVAPHPASYAFHSAGGIRECATMHCGCKWLFQFDLKDFFYTISEFSVYKVFIELGYKPLLAFELSRLCTTLRLPIQYKKSYIKKHDPLSPRESFPYDSLSKIGVLPQGAPTSPMLSNLVAKKLDISLYKYSQENGFIYTRYADDLTFSASILPPKKSIAQIKREIILIIRKNRFRENCKKIRIAGPGSKKIVLGLLIHGEKPRLSRQLRKRINRHIYSIKKFGIQEVANHNGFESVYGFFNHISGLMSFIQDVDRDQWEKLNSCFQKIKEIYLSTT